MNEVNCTYSIRPQLTDAYATAGASVNWGWFQFNRSHRMPTPKAFHCQSPGLPASSRLPWVTDENTNPTLKGLHRFLGYVGFQFCGTPSGFMRREAAYPGYAGLAPANPGL
jgi:hypothetical protein